MDTDKHFTRRHYIATAVVMGIISLIGIWRIAQLPRDAIMLAVGIGIGALAGLPMALLIIIARQKRDPYSLDDDADKRTADYQANYQEPEYTVQRPRVEHEADGSVTTYWPYEVEAVEIRSGEFHHALDARCTTDLASVLRTNARAIVLMSEWESHTRRKVNAWSQYAFPG